MDFLTFKKKWTTIVKDLNQFNTMNPDSVYMKSRDKTVVSTKDSRAKVMFDTLDEEFKAYQKENKNSSKTEFWKSVKASDGGSSFLFTALLYSELTIDYNGEYALDLLNDCLQLQQGKGTFLVYISKWRNQNQLTHTPTKKRAKRLTTVSNKKLKKDVIVDVDNDESGSGSSSESLNLPSDSEKEEEEDDDEKEGEKEEEDDEKEEEEDGEEDDDDEELSVSLLKDVDSDRGNTVSIDELQKTVLKIQQDMKKTKKAIKTRLIAIEKAINKLNN